MNRYTVTAWTDTGPLCFDTFAPDEVAAYTIAKVFLPLVEYYSVTLVVVIR